MFAEFALPNPLDFLEPGAVALLIAFLFIALTTLSFAFVKRIVVPGSFYDKEVARNDKLADVVERLTSAVEDLTKEVRYTKGGK